MATCEFDEKIIHQYFDDELNSGYRERVHNHLQKCQVCQNRLNALILFRQELQNSSISVGAPSELKEKIQENLRSEKSSQVLKLNLIEKLKLKITEYFLSRYAAAGISLAVVLIFVFIPSGSNLKDVAELLAQEYHKSSKIDNPSDGLISNSYTELCDYFKQNLCEDIRLPDCIGKEIRLASGYLIDIDGKKAACAIYSNGPINCSLFIIDSYSLSGDSDKVLVVNEKRIQYERVNNLNFICWEKDSVMYILAGCCPCEKLAGYIKEFI